MATIEALKPCFSISNNTSTLNKHRQKTITNKVTNVNISRIYPNSINGRKCSLSRSFLPKPIIVSSSRRSLQVSAVSGFTVDDVNCLTTSHNQLCYADHCSSFGGPYNNLSIVTGSYGSLSSVTLERPKPELDIKTNKPSFEAPIGDFDNNNGDNIGKGNVGGGDKGGGGSGDEDDYFEDFDDEDGDDEGLFSRRISLQELFDRAFIDAVLSEWQKTLLDLPAGIRLACELGVLSSAQLLKYLITDARPSFTRAIYRGLSKGMSREFLGRITADPSFLHKLLFEQFVTIACSARSEFKKRGDRIKDEWDLALINVFTAAACNLVVVWSLAPCCLYVNTFSSELQNRLQKLPNNIFEASYRFKEFDQQKRALSLVYKAVQFSLVGFTAGAIQSALLHLRTKGKERRLSAPIPPANTNALGYGAFLGLYTNWRYQMICGMDKMLYNHFNVIGVSLFFTAAFRILNAQLGEISRTMWLDADSFASAPKAQSNKSQKKRRVIRKKVLAV